MPGRPPQPPWRSPLGLELLDARKLPLTREAWLHLLAETIRAEGSQVGAARALGTSTRQLARWVAWLREHDEKGYAALPEATPGGWRPGHEERRARKKPATKA